ncbi:tail fiber assembly protein [Actinobacillus pleuropneumoniae serovar 4 str. M62]|nr:tail fiber assembly protein [Actinobacillus pleuropneumoniae serovar 4 str. M62]
MQGLHTIPADAAPVKETEYHLLINGRAAGKEIIVIDGNLSLTSKRPSQYHTHNGKEWVISAEKQAVKKAEEIAKMREQINALRDEKSASGVYVEALDKWFDSDAKAQSKLLGLKATMDLVGSDITVSWTCADNKDFENFGKPQLTAVIAAILQAENHNHTVARQHKAALEQADNPLEYDYSSGWSKTYADFLEENKNEK